MQLSFILEHPFRCTLCHLSFVRKFDFKRHMGTTHGPGMRCKLCTRTLKSATRSDMQIRHLLTGCVPFRRSLSEIADFDKMAVAKKAAKGCFEIVQ